MDGYGSFGRAVDFFEREPGCGKKERGQKDKVSPASMT
jgi:hypothetical protein